MKAARFVVVWTLLFVGSWIIVGGVVGLVAVLAIDVIGINATLFSVLGIAVVAIIVGAIKYEDTRR